MDTDGNGGDGAAKEKENAEREADEQGLGERKCLGIFLHALRYETKSCGSFTTGLPFWVAGNETLRV